MATPLLTRRRVVLAAGLFPFATVPGQVAEYAILNISQVALGRSAGSCVELQDQIRFVDGEIMRTRANAKKVGEEIRLKFLARNAALKASAERLKASRANDELDKAFGEAGVALSLLFLGLGVVMSSPLAIGSAAAASIIVGAGAFALQVIIKEKSNTPNIVVGYSLDRTLMFAEMLPEHLGSNSWKVVGNVIKLTSVLIPAKEVYEASHRLEQARTDLSFVVTQLDDIQRVLSSYGSNSARWANLYENTLQGLSASLQAYVAATKANNCLLPPPARGPSLRNP